MYLLQTLFEALANAWRPRQNISSHAKQQAYGRRWSRHRLRRVDRYTRRRPRRTR